MTNIEMYNQFGLLYNEAANKEMGYTPEEVSDFLNQSVMDLVQEIYFPDKNVINRGFDIGSDRERIFAPLKKTKFYNTFSTSNVYDNSIVITLPDNFLYATREVCDIAYNNIVYRNSVVKPTNEDELTDVLNNPYTKPYRDKALSVMIGNDKHIILGDDIDIITYRIFYLSKPIIIIVDLFGNDGVDCDLDYTIHNTIVKRAVEKALGSSGNPKYQIATNENKKPY